MEIGKSIRNLRINAGLTQKEVSEELHIGRTTLSGYETGRRIPDLDTLCRMADLFDVSIDSILGRKRPDCSGK